MPNPVAMCSKTATEMIRLPFKISWSTQEPHLPAVAPPGGDSEGRGFARWPPVYHIVRAECGQHLGVPAGIRAVAIMHRYGDAGGDGADVVDGLGQLEPGAVDRHGEYVDLAGRHEERVARVEERAAVHQVRSSIMRLACLSISMRPLSTSPPWKCAQSVAGGM